MITSTLPLVGLATASALSAASTTLSATPRANIRMTDNKNNCYFAVLHEFNGNEAVCAADQTSCSCRAPPCALTPFFVSPPSHAGDELVVRE